MGWKVRQFRTLGVQTDVPVVAPAVEFECQANLSPCLEANVNSLIEQIANRNWELNVMDSLQEQAEQAFRIVHGQVADYQNILEKLAVHDLDPKSDHGSRARLVEWVQEQVLFA